MNQNKHDMLESTRQDLMILDEQYNYAHEGISRCVKILNDEEDLELQHAKKLATYYRDKMPRKLTTKGDMIEFITEFSDRPIRTIDSAIPMGLWKDCLDNDTGWSAYAYYADGTEKLINLPFEVAKIKGGCYV